MQAIKEVPGDITKRRLGKRVKDRGTDCLKQLRGALYPVLRPLSNRLCEPVRARSWVGEPEVLRSRFAGSHAVLHYIYRV